MNDFSVGCRSAIKVSLLLAAYLLAGCTFGQQPEPTPIPLLVNTLNTNTATARPVFTVQRGVVLDELVFPAKVSLAKREDLFFAAPGRVKEVYVASGDTVELDEVIAVLDTRLLQLDMQAGEEALALAQQRLAAAEADLRFLTLQRQNDLQMKQLRLDAMTAVTGTNKVDLAVQELVVRGAELALEQLEAGVNPGLTSAVRMAEINLQKLQTGLADAQISAPFAGQVLLYDALEKGKVVQAYSPVAALVDPQALVIEANLLPADLESLHEGMAVQIRLNDAMAQPISGVIRTLPQPFGTGAGSSVVIEPGASGAAGPLRAGAGVTVSAQRGRANDALWLPPEAVQGYKGSYFVRLADGTEKAITVGIVAEDRVEIAAGLAPGEVVVGQ